MIVNADITVFNRLYDQATRLYSWRRTILHGVHANADMSSTQVNNDRRGVSDGIFRVPSHCKEYEKYVPPMDYKGYGWTFAPGDIIVPMVLNYDIDGDTDLTKAGVTFYKIDSAKDNRRGLNPHLRARCKG